MMMINSYAGVVGLADSDRLMIFYKPEENEEQAPPLPAEPEQFSIPPKAPLREPRQPDPLILFRMEEKQEPAAANPYETEELDALMGTGESLPHWTKTALAKDAKKTLHPGWEEVFIPAKPPAPIPESERRVAISELDAWAQKAFKGYEYLNRIQSRIFETAYYNNDNVLVCAPTGAGKTNIAMLAVLHEVRQNLEDGALRKDDFKIVYVAPMKALAAEVTATFSKRLEPLQLQVRELTGDMQLTKQELQQTQCLQLNQWLKADLDTWANDLNDAVKAMTELTDRTEDGLGEKTAFKRAGNDCWVRAFDLLFDIVRREGREGMESLFTEIGEAL